MNKKNTPSKVKYYLSLGKSRKFGLNNIQIVGRASDCDISISEKSVSKKHASITVKNDIVTLIDLNSASGTTVNNKMVKGKLELKPGDIVKFGNSIGKITKPSLKVWYIVLSFFIILLLLIGLIPTNQSNEKTILFEVITLASNNRYSEALDRLHSAHINNKSLEDSLVYLIWTSNLENIIHSGIKLDEAESIFQKMEYYRNLNFRDETLDYWHDSLSVIIDELVLLQRVDRALANYDFINAIELINQLNRFNREGKLLEYYKSRGYKYYEENQINLAFADFQLLHEMFPDDPEIYNMVTRLGQFVSETEIRSHIEVPEIVIFDMGISSETLYAGDSLTIQLEMLIPQSVIMNYIIIWESNLIDIDYLDLYSSVGKVYDNILVMDMDTLRCSIVDNKSSQSVASVEKIVTVKPLGMTENYPSSQLIHDEKTLSDAAYLYGIGRRYHEQLHDMEKAVDYYLQTFSLLQFDIHCDVGKRVYKRLRNIQLTPRKK